jgi:hypothetical protein
LWSRRGADKFNWLRLGSKRVESGRKSFGFLKYRVEDLLFLIYGGIVKKKKLKILIIIAIPVTVFLFWIWYSQTHTGSRNGQVFDANTGKPIESAVVDYTWTVAGFLQDAIGGGGPTVVYETLTDKEGKYYIPSQRIKRSKILQWTLQPEDVMVYKDKYAVFKLLREYKKPPFGRSFRYPDIKQPYIEKNNIIKLYPFKEGESHIDHLDWIEMYLPKRNKLLLKELESERKRAEQEIAAKWRR